MKISNTENYMHVLGPLTNTWTILRNIANSKDQEEAFYICNISNIVQKFETWKTALSRVEPFYVVKCNDSLTVLEVLAALGVGFDCASKSEINQVLSLGVSPDRIIYNNPVKPASQIKHAAASEVSLITFDSASELQKIKKLHPNAKLAIQIRCETDDALNPFSVKFGCDPKSEAPELLKTAKKLDLQVVGVSLHMESTRRGSPAYSGAIEAARELFDYASELGYNFSLLDLGEGFPRDGASIDEIFNEINEALDLHFPDPSVRITAKAGSFFVRSAYILACKIHAIRTVNKGDPETGDYHMHRMYYVDDGVYGSFNSVLYNQQPAEPQPLNEHPMRKMYSSSIWGPTSDPMDQVIEEVILPEMNIGEWIVFENMGAYTMSVSSPLNEFPIPKVHAVADESTWSLLKDLPLTEDHFIMGNLPDSMKINSNSTQYTLPTIPTRLPLMEAMPFENDGTFQFGYFEQCE